MSVECRRIMQHMILIHYALECSGPDLAGGRPGPSGVFGISERDWLLNYRVLKIEGFGRRPPVGGRPGARGSHPP